MDTKGYKIETLFGLKHLLAETVEETHWNRKRQDYPSAVLLENRPVVIHTRGKTNFLFHQNYDDLSSLKKKISHRKSSKCFHKTSFSFLLTKL